MNEYLNVPRKRSHIELVALVFTVIALVSTFLADILAADALAATVGLEAKNMNSEDMVMPAGWREVMLIGLVSVICGGVYCAVNGAFRQWRSPVLACLMLLLVWMGLHTGIAFLDGFQLYEVVYFKGPATWLGLLAIVLGQYNINWNVISRLLTYFAYSSSAIILYSMATVAVNDRFDAMRAIFGYMQTLQYPALWMLLVAFSQKRFLISVIPFLVYALGSLIVVTRSLILSSILYLLAAIYIGYRFKASKGRKSLVLYSAVIVAFAAVGGSVFFESRLLDAMAMLVDRLDDDSRSGQYEQFLSQISFLDVLVGRGLRGVWSWNGSEYASIDGSYTLMLFTGGIPLLATYVFVMFSAPYRCVRTTPPLHVMAAATTLMFWALALTGFGIYAVPSFRFSHVVLCLMVGMCMRHLWDQSRQRGGVIVVGRQ